jgi:hypothetical protein
MITLLRQQRSASPRCLPVFFISTHDNPLNESRASHRLAAMGRQVASQLDRTLKSSRLRKSIVSLQREQSHFAVSAPQLAKQMGAPGGDCSTILQHSK